MNTHPFEPGDFALSVTPHLSVELPTSHDTRRLGAAVGESAAAGSVIGLVGNLGAGKTTFTQGLTEALGGDGATSPTYTLLNTYRTTPPIFHFDLYRLENVGDLEGVGYWDYMESGEGITVVEWVDQIPEAWPGEGIMVRLSYADGGRLAHIWGPEATISAVEAAF